jgi:hypothetical protein
MEGRMRPLIKSNSMLQLQPHFEEETQQHPTLDSKLWSFFEALKSEQIDVVNQDKCEFHPIEIVPLGISDFIIFFIGNTNVGKSTLLTKLTGMFGLFNTSMNRETACIWRYKVDQVHSQYELREIWKDGGIKVHPC